MWSRTRVDPTGLAPYESNRLATYVSCMVVSSLKKRFPLHINIFNEEKNSLDIEGLTQQILGRRMCLHAAAVARLYFFFFELHLSTHMLVWVPCTQLYWAC